MAVHWKETSEWKKTLADGTEVIRTCAWSPPGCHSVGCGLRLFVKDGELVKVEGDPEHPLTKGKLCVRCLALKEYIYHPDRIKYPMKRAGKRGEDKWERISWDEALDTIIEKTEEITEKYGPESIISMVGTGRQAVRFQYPLTSIGLGSPNVCYSQSGWSCMGPRNTVTTMVLGGGYVELDWAAGLPGRYDDPEYVLPEYILMWGKDPLKTNPDGLWGHSVIEMLKRGSKLIMVDPRMSWLATKAEQVLQLKPGTDTALALAMLHIIINEDLYDHEFVEKWTHGFEELKERVQQYSPAWAAKATGVPESQIVEVTRILAAADTVSLCMGLATDQNPNGVQLVHALISMISITGNLDVPGGTEVGRLMVMDMNADAPLPEELTDKVIGQKEYPALPLVLNTTHPDLTLETFETEKPYPLRMVWISSSNFISPTNSATQEMVRRGQKIHRILRSHGPLHESHDHGPGRYRSAGRLVCRARRYCPDPAGDELGSGRRHQQGDRRRRGKIRSGNPSGACQTEEPGENQRGKMGKPGKIPRRSTQAVRYQVRGSEENRQRTAGCRLSQT